MNKEETILIHTHFHKRRTGITRSIENVLPYFSNFKTYVFGYNISGNKISYSQVKKLVFSSKKVVVHCHRNNEILRFLWLRILGGKFKLIITRHAESKPSKFSLFLFKKADALVTLTLKVSLKINIKNTLIPHGVDTNLFIPKQSSSINKVLQEHIILCAGRVRKAKGQHILVKAAIPVLKKHKNYAVVIVGKTDDKNYVAELHSLLKEHNLENQVYFINETSKIITFYQASKLVVVPSFSEGFSLVCAESMSCGCTTIATKDVGIHSNIIQHKENGYLFEAGNITELSNYLFQIIDEKLPFTGEKARETILQNWSAQKEASELSKIYKLVF